MSNPLFDNAPEYDSDMDTLADFVIEPTTAHIPPPPSPLPNTCLCGRTTRDDDADEPLYCSEACARLDAFHALTARSRSNSLAPTPITTAPPTPLFPQLALRESVAGLFVRPDAIATPPAVSTPLSAVSSFASVESTPLPIEMSSHYRRVTAKRERMERAGEDRDRSRSHSRTHSKARPIIEHDDDEDCHLETHIERQVGSDGEEFVPATTAVHVHIAVNVEIEHHVADSQLDADQLSRALSATMLGPASGVAWRDPFADPCVSSPTRELSIAPTDVPASYESHPSSELNSIAATEDFSPFDAYAPVSVPPGLPSRKSSVCFAGVGPAGRVMSIRSRAQSDARACEGSPYDLSEKPLPSTPENATMVPRTSFEPSAESSASPVTAPEPSAMPSPGVSLDLPSPMPSFDLDPEPATPTSSVAPPSPCTPSHNTQQNDFDPQATPSRSATSPASHLASLGDTPKRSPAMTSRPGTSPQRRVPRRLQTLDTLPRAKIFSMVVDPEFDIFAGEVPQTSAAASLKRVDTAPELNTGRSGVVQYPASDAAAISPGTPHKNQLRTRARATSTPRRPNLAFRQRTSSTPSPPGAIPLGHKAPRRGRMHAPPPTPPVSPSHVSSPRPPVAQDPGSWQSFAAAFESWGWNSEHAPPNRQLEDYNMGLHRRQESAESSGSSATDLSWTSSTGAPPSGSSVCSWPASGEAEIEAESYAHVPGILRARSPATSSVRTIVPPPRGSSLPGDGSDTEHVTLQLCHARRSRRQSSLAALDNILAMEDSFWEQTVVVRDADDSVDNDGMGVQFRGDAGGFAFPATKGKPAFEPILRIAGISRPPSVANLLNTSSDTSGSKVVEHTVQLDHLAPPPPPTVDYHAHRTSASQFPVSPSIASARPSPEIDTVPSPIPHMSSTSLFDAPVTASPIMGTPALSRGSPALPGGSPISAQFALRTPGSPYLSVPLGPSRRTSRSTDASSVLLRTASAARLAAALNAAADDDEDASPRRVFEDLPYARYSPGTGQRMRRSGSLGRSSSLGGSSSSMGLGLALGVTNSDHDSRRSSSEPWNGLAVITPGIVAESISMSRSGSRMNLMDPSVLAVPEEEEEQEPEEDYGQVVSTSKFANIAVSPGELSVEEVGEEASPLIDAFPHPMGGYFPGSRFASRAGTPVKGLHGSSSGLSLRQVAMGNARQENTEEREPSDDDEDEEIVTTVQRMRHSMQLLSST
ncbi:unnamed protein product [Rhizoctonia solani]|uniref:Uncharacterized protein n=1 Tax=Rhizoctonia solani TaxID=456999 RepID=A0A8H3H799_9AGAM|nr:unnamed protein product [Rhizoctonia solani]